MRDINLDQNIKVSASEKEQSQEQAEVGQWRVLFAATLRWWWFRLDLTAFPFQLERQICHILPCSTTDKTHFVDPVNSLGWTLGHGQLCFSSGDLKVEGD